MDVDTSGDFEVSHECDGYQLKKNKVVLAPCCLRTYMSFIFTSVSQRPDQSLVHPYAKSEHVPKLSGKHERSKSQ